MPTMKALLVAIDDYGDPRNNLNSCIADSQAIEQMLRTTYGFSEIRSLRDVQATQAAVDSGLTWLVENASANDRLVFHFSGHGYQVANGNVLEEVLVLRDGFCRDDRLSQFTQGLPPGIFTAILDSCYAGGAEKLVFADQGVEIVRTKTWKTAEDGAIQQKTANFGSTTVFQIKPFGSQPITSPSTLTKLFSVDSLTAATDMQGGSAKSVIPAPVSDEVGQTQLNGLLMAACLENETATAKTAKTKGLSVFTYGLLESLQALGDDVSVDGLMADVQRRLVAEKFRQTPVLKLSNAPSDLGSRSFVLLKAASAPTGSDTQDATLQQLIEMILTNLRKDFTVNTMPSTDPGDSKFVSLDWDRILNDPRFRDLIANLTKDYQTSNGVQPMPEGDEKFWGAVASLVGSIAPVLIRELTKDYQPGNGVQPMPEGDEKFWGAVANIVTQIAPVLIRELTKDYQPGTGVQPMPEGDEKFWGAVASLVGSIAPVLIRELTKDYQPGYGVQPMPEGDEKFWGAVANIVTQIAPVLIRELTKDYQPGNGVQPMLEGDEKFWGAVASLVGSIAPVLIRELTKDYQPGNGVQPMLEGDEKFWGAVASIVGSIAPVLIRELTKDYQPTAGSSDPAPAQPPLSNGNGSAKPSYAPVTG